jgi:hypothetical protein
MINGPMVHSINNSINSVLPSFENVQYPQVLYLTICTILFVKQKKLHIMMPFLFVIYGLLCTGSELKFNKRNAPKYLAICTILFVKPKKYI